MLAADKRLMGLKQRALLLIAQPATWAYSCQFPLHPSPVGGGGNIMSPDDTCTFRVALLERNLWPRAHYFLSKLQTLLQTSQAHSPRKLAQISGRMSCNLANSARMCRKAEGLPQQHLFFLK